MKNQKMIKTAKAIDKFLSVLHIIFIVTIILSVLAVAALAIFGKQIDPLTTVDLGNLSIELCSGVYNQSATVKMMIVSVIYAMVIIGCGLYIIYLLREILAPMKEGLPFANGTSKKLRKFGWVELVIGVIFMIGDSIIMTVQMNAVDFSQIFNSAAVSKYTLTTVGGFVFLPAILITFFLSYIFEYGETLQQESDELL